MVSGARCLAVVVRCSGVGVGLDGTGVGTGVEVSERVMAPVT